MRRAPSRPEVLHAELADVSGAFVTAFLSQACVQTGSRVEKRQRQRHSIEDRRLL